ncbi:hypothetical protein T07_11041 [Trichinella nelsoni]|uniref:Uncharacterized protein n=1 Tax=Trichinella nelsoni TaxID=6336 RepID=A0A0V0RJ82_9BILA|nr:hypothetical protein T07_11041 [Trichinella nelsoni]
MPKFSVNEISADQLFPVKHANQFIILLVLEISESNGKPFDQFIVIHMPKILNVPGIVLVTFRQLKIHNTFFLTFQNAYY